MSLWRQITHGLRVLTNRARADRDVADEIHDYLEESAAANVARGMSPDEARRAASMELGNASVAREQVRSYGWENMVSTLLADLRYGSRQLLNHRGFAIIAIITLALGIGATTAIFSAVNPVLFQPLPYPHPDRIMMIWESGGGSPQFVTFASFHGVSERSHSFEALAVMKPWQPTMTSATQPERFEGQRVSSAYFQSLGVLPVLGRDFQPSDDQYKGPNVVILSDKLWRRRFAANPAIIGRPVTLDGNSFTVIGVMPPQFENVLSSDAELWAPLQYNPALLLDTREWGHHLRMIGRLQPGVSPSQAKSELDVIRHTLAQMYVKGYDSSGGAPVGFLVSPLHSDLTQSVRPALLVLLGAVLLVLMIAAVNVTNLLLARGAQRRAEFAMRLAIGASRGRLIRQLLTESLLLSFVGGVLGIAVAQAGVKALIALSPVGLPRANAIQLDLTAFSFGLIITTFVGLIVGLSPALHASRKDPLETIQQNSRSTAGGYHLLRRTLVVSEVALALVLLIGAGLLLRSLHRIFSIDPGFDGSNLLTMQVQESGHRYDADADRNRFFAQALDAVRDVPGVESAAFTSQLPLSGDFETFGVQFEKHPNEMSDAAYRYAVSPDYFQTMHIPLLRGRLLTEQDRVGAPMAVLISVSFAKRMFPNEDPIGHRLRSGPAMGHDELPWATVVGVVGDVKQTSLGFDQPYAFYTTSPQWFWVDTAQSLVVRTHGNAAALVPALRAAIWSVDKDQPIVRVATMEKLLATSEAERHFALILFEVFGIVALILVASGIYGILAGSVTERTREIGIRTALGASRHQILSLILSQGVRLTVCGIAIGIVGALLTSQTLTTLLFGVSHLDPVTYAAVIALLFTVAIIACWIPAWRAAHVDPSITLRAE